MVGWASWPKEQRMAGLGNLYLSFTPSVVLMFWKVGMVLCLVTTYLFLSSFVLFLKETLWMTVYKTFLIIFHWDTVRFQKSMQNLLSRPPHTHTLVSCLRQEMRPANHRVMTWFNHSGTDAPYFIRLWKRGAFIKLNVAAQQIHTNNSEKFCLVGILQFRNSLPPSVSKVAW